MKPYPDTPSIEHLRELPAERLAHLFGIAQVLDDTQYLHWEGLRHRTPPKGLSILEWWLALKLKRIGNRLSFPALTSKRGSSLTVSRHARLDAGFAAMDRRLTGPLAVPDAVRNQATRDRYLASSLMEEAIHSSLFEGAVSTRESAKDMLRSNRRPINKDEQMILNNHKAMLRLRDMARAPLTLDCVLELHRILTEGTLKNPDQAGRLQKPGETRVNVIDDRVGRIVHTPPPAEELPTRMAKLIDFANGADAENGQYVHPVLRSILLHFQLGYDHPFADGNGRTARALFYWSLLRRDYWLVEYLSISRPIYRARQPYELAFVQVESDAQDATYFVLQQLGVIEQATNDLFEYVERKNQEHGSLQRQLQNQPDLNHRQIALLGHALRHPDAVYTHDSHANSHRVSGVTARSDLLKLAERGWLIASKSGKRSIYQPVDNLDVLLTRRGQTSTASSTRSDSAR